MPLVLRLAATLAIIAVTMPAARATQGDWRDDAPGKLHRLSAADLPKPYATQSGFNRPEHRGAARRRDADGDRRAQASRCSPTSSTSRASSASRPTATFSSPKAKRAAIAVLRAERATAPRQR